MSSRNEAWGGGSHVGRIVALIGVAGVGLVLLMRPAVAPPVASRGVQEFPVVVSDPPLEEPAVVNCDLVGNCLVP